MDVIDQFNDEHNAMLMGIAKENPEAVSQVKEASLERPEELDDRQFAFPEYRRFPIHNTKQAKLSKLYAEKQADKLPDEVMNRIDKTLRLADEDPSTFSTTEKEASAQPGSEHYLLPHKKRLFVGSEDDVKQAGRALLDNRRRLKTSSLNQASNRLIKKAMDYNVDADDVPLEIYKYAGMTNCDAGELLDSLEARAAASDTVQDRGMYEKLANLVKEKFPEDGVITNRDELTKIASAVEDADQKAKLTDEYGKGLRDPMEAVFNRDKIAGQTVELGPTTISREQLREIPEEVFENLIGRPLDAKPSDPEFAAILQSLPDDTKRMLGQKLKPHLDAMGG